MLDEAFEAIKTYDWGTDRKPLEEIDKAAIASLSDDAARKDLERRLAEVLKTDVSRDAKDFACRKLMIIGSAASVATLASLLSNKEQAHMARFALERIPAPEAAQALRDALPTLNGPLKIGVISSLGVRRDADSVAALAKLLSDSNPAVARAAAIALGDIRSSASGKALSEAKSVSTEVQPAVTDASLFCAGGLLAEGKKDEALAIYKTYIGDDRPKHVRVAATKGMLACAGKNDEENRVRIGQYLRCGVGSLCAVLAFAFWSFAKDEPGDELVQMVIKLLSEKDKDLRAVGLEQVRNEAKGAATTKQFAAQLPKLSAAEQVGLLSALADRGDHAALPAVIDLLNKSNDGTVRVAAVTTIGSLGDSTHLALLLKALASGSAAEKTAAKLAVQRLRGDDVPGAIAAALKNSPPPMCVVLIDVLSERRALTTVGDLLAAATGDDAKVRRAAMVALSQMASANHLPDMFKAVLKAENGTEREAAEKAVAVVAGGIDDADARASAMLLAWANFNAQDQIALLPALGRVGGAKIYTVVKRAIADQDLAHRDIGLRALCNWSDSTVLDELLALAGRADSPAHRAMIFQAFVRIGATRDQRTDLERLARMKQGMAAARTAEERALVVNRCRTSYSIESLRYVLPFLDQPEFVQLACETIVELAHHRELREPNKGEFDPALDKVIKLSKDAVVVDRANRYKRGETWARPKPTDATNSP